MMPKLVAWADGRRVEALLGDVCRVGAAPENDLVVTVAAVSRAHARVVAIDRKYAVEDAGSRNGTFVNGVRATRTLLTHLDVISLGGVVDVVFLDRDGWDAARVTGGVRRVSLEWLDGPERGTVRELSAGPLVFGRDEGAGVVVTHPAVSRSHVRITVTEGGVTLEDLNSGNGTRLNGQRTTELVPLRDGDEFELGGARKFRVRIAGPAPAVADSASAVRPSVVDRTWRTRMLNPADIAAMLEPRIDPAPARGTRRVRVPPSTAALRLPAAPDPPSPPSPSPAKGDVAVSPAAPDPPAPQAAGPKTVYMAFDMMVPAAVTKASEPAEPEAVPPAPAAQPPSEPPAGRGPKTTLGFSLPVVPEALRGDPPPQESQREKPPQPRPQTKYVPAMPATMPASIAAQDVQRPVTRAVRLSGPGGVFTLAPGRSTVGRAAEATVRVDTREVSRLHAVIVVEGESISLEDMGSANGTKVNGEPIQPSTPVPLSHGDRVMFGELEFVIEHMGNP